MSYIMEVGCKLTKFLFHLRCSLVPMIMPILVTTLFKILVLPRHRICALIMIANYVARCIWRQWVFVYEG